VDSRHLAPTTYAAPACRSTPPIALPREAIPYVASPSKHDASVDEEGSERRHSRRHRRQTRQMREHRPPARRKSALVRTHHTPKYIKVEVRAFAVAPPVVVSTMRAGGLNYHTRRPACRFGEPVADDVTPVSSGPFGSLSFIVSLLQAIEPCNEAEHLAQTLLRGLLQLFRRKHRRFGLALPRRKSRDPARVPRERTWPLRQ
jgi:hypothetical protein